MDRNDKRIARSLSLQIYYAWIISDNHPREILNYFSNIITEDKEYIYFASETLENNKREVILNDNIIDYTYKLLEMTIQKSDEVDIHISSKLKNWDIKRIAIIDKLILRLSLTEMFFFDDVPPKVSIVEGVEIGKVFSNKDSSSFINGVLDSVYNDLKNEIIKI